MSKVWILVLLTGLIAIPCAVHGQVPAVTDFRVPFDFPKTVAGLTLADSGRVGDAVVYNYRGRRVSKLDVFVYPAPAEDNTRETSHETLRREASDFKEVLARGVTEGLYEAYEVAFETETPVQTAGGVVPGIAVAVVLERGRKTFTSFFYVYSVNQVLVKIRLTLPDSEWSTNPAMDFPAKFIQTVAARR